MMTDPCCSARLSLGLLLALAPASGLAAQDAPPDHAAHHRFVFPASRSRTGPRCPNTVLSYGTYGRLNDRQDNVILLPSSYMADHHDNDWLIGPGLALDTTRYFLVATELFGNGHSSSPSNTPEPHHGPRFPRATIRDNVEAVHRLLVDELQVSPPGRDHRVFHGGRAGVPVGGELSRLQRTASSRWPGRPDAGPTAKSGSRREIAAIQSDTAFRGGDYTAPPKQGIDLFGLVWAGWLTSQQWWHDELWKGPTWPPGESYESVVAISSTPSSPDPDANDLILQAQTWQRHDVGATPGFQGSIERALGSIRARVLYMPVETDLYFPVSDARAEARLIRRVNLVPIPSVWGHVAGGGGDEGAKPFINAKIAAFLK